LRPARRPTAQRAAGREPATSDHESPWSRAAAAADGVVERAPAPATRRESPPVAPRPAAHTSSGPTTDQLPRKAASGSPSPAAAGRLREDRPRRRAGAVGVSRWRLAAPIALLAVLAAGVAAVAIATSGSPRPSAASGKSSAATSGTRLKNHPSSANKTAPSAKKRAPSANKTGASAKKHVPPANGTASSTNNTSSGSDTSTAAASGTTTTPATLAASSADAASTPVEAVESFYHLAAAHQYAKAWSLADPNFQQQLEGYQSFQAGQADDRSITFNKATVTNQTASSATVAVQTTSRRSDGTESCAGSVDLVKNSASWQLDQIGINCR
jgi:hypothetical protein